MSNRTKTLVGVCAGLVLAAGAPAFAEEPGDLLWAKGVHGSNTTDLRASRGVTAFPDGSAIVVTNIFGGNLVFGAGEPNETLLSGMSLAIVRYNANGTLAWARGVAITGGQMIAAALDVAAFPDGSCVVTGTFGTLQGYGGATAVFGQGEPGQTTLVSDPAGSADVFVARYNANGSVAWARRDGGDGFETANSIAAFADGSSMITGEYQSYGTTPFGLPQGRHFYVARYNADGTLAWVRAVNDTVYGAVIGFGVAAFPDGSSVVTGEFSAGYGVFAVFGAGEPNQTSLMPAGGSSSSGGSPDVFVARYNADGTLAWAKRAGAATYSEGGATDQGWDVAAFGDGSSVVTGLFRGSAVFGPGEANATTLVSAGGSDIFVARYNANGTLAWARRAGSGFTGEAGLVNWYELGFGVAAFPNGSSVITGRFFQSAQFGAGQPSATTLHEHGYGDVFVAVYDAAGVLAWARRAGGSSAEDGRGVASFEDGTFVITGNIGGLAVFGAGEPHQTTLSGVTNRFITRYTAGAAPEISAPASIVQECDDTDEHATVNFVFDVTPGPADLLRVRDVTGARTLLTLDAPAEQTYGVGPVEFPHGNSTVVIELLDGANVVKSASFAVQIEDTTPPVISGAVSQTIELQGPLTTLYRSMLGITVADACDPAPTLTFAPGAVGLGTTTVVATARDATGNTSNATFDVTVVDTTDPVFTVASADIERHCEAAETLVSFDVLAEDLSGPVSIACVDETARAVDPSGTPFTVGVHTVTCTATDSSGNDDTWSFLVTIIDDEAPVIVVPADITVGTAPGVAFAFVDFAVTATDACDPAAGIVCTAPWGVVQSGDAFPIGTTIVTCTATDHSGNVATSQFNITVEDREAPVLSSPATASLVTDCCGSALTVSPETLGVTATDNADPTVSITWAPATVGPGTTEVVVTATDDDGNHSEKSVAVTVLRGAFDLRFLQPLDNNVDNRINPGRTVPVKVRVSCDNVFDAGVTAIIDRVERIDGSGTPIANEVIDDAGSSNDDGVTMRLADGFYIFNLSTAGWASTSGARFRVVVRVSEAGHVDSFGEVVLKNK